MQTKKFTHLKQRFISMSLNRSIPIFFSFLIPLIITMAPVTSPVPNVFNPIAPIQNNWDKIEPWIKGYTSFIGSAGTVFGFAAAIALISEHGFKFPRWPFTAERWNPEPSFNNKNKKEEVTEEQIVEDELAEVVGALGRRSADENGLEWVNRELEEESNRDIFKHKGTMLRGLETLQEDEPVFEDIKNKTQDAVEKGKYGVGAIEEQIQEIVRTAKEPEKKSGKISKGSSKNRLSNKGKDCWRETRQR